MTDTRTRVDINRVRKEVGPDGKPVSRSTIYRKLDNDPTFPRPIDDGYRLQWYLDEVCTWIASRPRRQYRGNHGDGVRLPAEPGVIVIDGGRP